MNTMNDDTIRKRNDRYRDQEPSGLHRAAFWEVLETGSVSSDAREKMADRLYDPFSDDRKDTPVDPFEPTLPTQDEGNGLGSAVVRKKYHVNLHISKKLWHQQPIGVLLRPINDEVLKAGEAVVTDVDPRSADVEAGVMPAEHVKLKLEPLPLFLEKWVGENGYPTI